MSTDRSKNSTEKRDVPPPAPVDAPADAYQRVTEATLLRTGLRNVRVAQKVVEAVITSLAETLDRSERRAAVQLLPPRIGAIFEKTPGDRITVQAFEERLARRLGIDRVLASEYASVVCQGLSQTLEPADLTALRERLPKALETCLSIFPTPPIPSSSPRENGHGR